MFGAESAPMREMKTEPLAMSQMVRCKVGRKEHLFRSGGDLSIDKGRPYKGYPAFCHLLTHLLAL